MYRTKTWNSELATTSLSIPVCIPSMGRPDAPIFKSLIRDGSFKKQDVFVFIRNTKKEQDYYKCYEDVFTLVTLPDWVDEIGTTRKAIVDWALEKNYENIFMFDDRIKDVAFLSPSKSKNGNDSLTRDSESTFYKALKVWERILKEHPFTVSCPSHKGFSWYPESINADYEVNNGNCCACVSINVFDLEEYDINYKKLSECGGEDLTLLIDVMMAGLPICKITDLDYDEVSSINIDVGGNHSDGTTLMSRCEERNKIFWENTLGLKPGEKHPWVFLRKSGGGVYPVFKWKYWKEFYNNNKAKEV